jgi:hypothetical protein
MDSGALCAKRTSLSRTTFLADDLLLTTRVERWEEEEVG